MDSLGGVQNLPVVIGIGAVILCVGLIVGIEDVVGAGREEGLEEALVGRDQITI